MNGLRGKRALITGGTRGIGGATAELFAEHGAHVMLGDRNRHADAEALVASITQRHGVSAAAQASDIATGEGADALVCGVVGRLGGLDFFVGSAGIWPPNDVPLDKMTDAHWRRTMAENVDAMFYTTRAAIRAM